MFDALLVNWGKLAVMFHGKFHFIKSINVRKYNIVRVWPLTAVIIKGEIKLRAFANQRHHQG